MEKKKTKGAQNKQWCVAFLALVLVFHLPTNVFGIRHQFFLVVFFRS